MTFECETAQTPSCVAWLKGHTELAAGGRFEMSQKETVLALTIKHLEENDSDIYTCDVGTAKSMAKLTVNGRSVRMDVCLAGVLSCPTGQNLTDFLTPWFHLFLSTCTAHLKDMPDLFTVFSQILLT